MRLCSSHSSVCVCVYVDNYFYFIRHPWSTECASACVRVRCVWVGTMVGGWTVTRALSGCVINCVRRRHRQPAPTFVPHSDSHTPWTVITRLSVPGQTARTHVHICWCMCWPAAVRTAHAQKEAAGWLAIWQLLRTCTSGPLWHCRPAVRPFVRAYVRVCLHSEPFCAAAGFVPPASRPTTPAIAVQR